MKIKLFNMVVDTEQVTFVCEECGKAKKVKARQLATASGPVTKIHTCHFCGEVKWCAICVDATTDAPDVVVLCE